jgi:hypothetical protein
MKSLSAKSCLDEFTSIQVAFSFIEIELTLAWAETA